MYTVFSAFAGIAAAANKRPMLCVPRNERRNYLPDGAEFSYGDVEVRSLELVKLYAAAGYGHGHRVLLLLENRPEYFFHFLALNAIGASIVPVNPDYRMDEMVYQAEKASVDLIVGLTHRAAELQAVAGRVSKSCAAISIDHSGAFPSPATPPPHHGIPNAETEAAILFTSGSTGFPKGCVVSNRYMLLCAEWYASTGGLTNFRYGQSRHFNPLPLYHMGGLCMASMSMMVTAGCVILAERFQPKRFLADAISARATSMHYLGVVPAMLLAQEPSELDRRHSIAFAIGAGANAALIERFELRFGIPCVEGWAMTETGRAIWNSEEPRQRGRNAVGRPANGLQVRIEDASGDPAAVGALGELTVRWGGSEGPRWGFFDGYHGDAEATEEAWRGGWFHSGDMVTQDPDGTIIFVDRKKNVIRRSGENIAAAEVEQILLTHPEIEQVAAIAVTDDMRQEEVCACIKLRPGVPKDRDMAEALFHWANARMAYFKTPGWIIFKDELPTTGSQKIAKAQMLAPSVDLLSLPDAFDFRTLKRRVT
jgi:crotonobetaine/carnitine-CoA ligase